MYQDKDLLEISFLLELEIFDKQGLFLYPFRALEGYKNHLEGHIIDAKESFEKAIRINPTKPEGYVLLAQTLQLMSGYDNPEYKIDAEENYKKAMEIMGTNEKNTLFVGDQLFTDVWGAKRVGIYSILVKPIHPKEEIQIVLKRYLEKIVLFLEQL